jgi:hypothetical protein
MPEFVTCPACGCRVQTAEALLGRQIRCFGCNHAFIATADRTFLPPRPQPAAAPARLAEDGAEGRERLPFCPGCGRRIPWEVLRCPLCGEELEPEAPGQRLLAQARGWERRDGVPHRARLIGNLGTASLIIGCLSMCLCGAGAALSVPLGIAAWVMGGHDLEEMRQGRMDPAGQAQTEGGRSAGLAGTIISLVIAAGFATLFLHW